MANWAAEHIATLARGDNAKFRPHGGSMTGRVESGQLCEVTPIADLPIEADDIVLVKVHGTIYLHLIKQVGQDGRFQIGNNKGHINGWVERSAIYGKLVDVSD